jgi:hypothetical protein
LISVRCSKFVIPVAIGRLHFRGTVKKHLHQNISSVSLTRRVLVRQPVAVVVEAVAARFIGLVGGGLGTVDVYTTPTVSISVSVGVVADRARVGAGIAPVNGIRQVGVAMVCVETVCGVRRTCVFTVGGRCHVGGVGEVDSRIRQPRAVIKLALVAGNDAEKQRRDENEESRE